MKLINSVLFAIILILLNRKMNTMNTVNVKIIFAGWLPSGWLPFGWLPSGRLPVGFVCYVKVLVLCAGYANDVED